MKILDKYELRGKDGDWTLLEHTTVKSGENKGKPREIVIGYWGDLKHALEKIIRLEASSADSLQEYVDRIESVYQKVKDEINRI